MRNFPSAVPFAWSQCLHPVSALSAPSDGFSLHQGLRGPGGWERGVSSSAVIEVLTLQGGTWGELEEFLADVRQLEQILARVDVGLTSMRVLRYMVAGAEAGRVALLFKTRTWRWWGGREPGGAGNRQLTEKQAIDERWRSGECSTVAPRAPDGITGNAAVVERWCLHGEPFGCRCAILPKHQHVWPQTATLD